MDPKHFPQPAGRLLRVGQGEAAYTAFVPAPLPPALTPDWETAAALSEADRALGELAGLGRTLANPRLLIGPFLRREAVLSSKIEGTHTGLAELYAFEAQQLALFPDAAHRPDDAREVLNYVEALEYGLERIESLPLSLRLIREVHERLMRGVRGDHATPGEFRRTQNWIGASDSVLNTASFVPPPVTEMTEALGQLEAYLHADSPHPPLLRLALIHYQFEAIHPFIDGNGRIGRLLIALLLCHWKLLPLPLLYLSAYFERRRDDYYAGLLAVSQRGAWAEWIRFFVRGVAEQATDAVVRARRLQELQAEWRARVLAESQSPAPLRLIDLLFEQPVVTIPDAAKRLGVAYNSASRAIARLGKLSILRQVSSGGYDKTFVAEGILRAVLEPSDPMKFPFFDKIGNSKISN